VSQKSKEAIMALVTKPSEEERPVFKQWSAGRKKREFGSDLLLKHREKTLFQYQSRFDRLTSYITLKGMRFIMDGLDLHQEFLSVSFERL
jgi:hypothetical protein